jgi:glycosyltransferase involved in cell wall biosynthesis
VGWKLLLNRSLPTPLYGKIGWPWTEETTPLPPTMPDGRPWPRISIVTPSYNQGQFIEETIRSVLLQGYPNLEYIIIDGGSTDDSVEIIKKYEPWLTYWISEPDRGQSHAINKGIRQATSDILLWLNSDDLCLPGSFQLVANAYQANPNTALVIGQAYLIDADGLTVGELRSQFTSWEDLITNPRNVIRQVSTFFSRRLFDELGLIDESLHIALDTELLIRFTKFYQPLILDEYLTAYRTHSGAKSHNQRIKGYAESDRLRAKYFIDKKMAGVYRKRSAAKWIQLSRFSDVKITERITCMLHAIRNQPSLLLSRKFASSVKKLYIDGVSSNFLRKAA